MNAVRWSLRLFLALAIVVPHPAAGADDAPAEVAGVDLHSSSAHRMALCGHSVLERDLDQTQRLFDSNAFRARAAALFDDRPEIKAAFALAPSRFSIGGRRDGCLEVTAWLPTYTPVLQPGSFGRRFSERRRPAAGNENGAKTVPGFRTLESCIFNPCG